MSAKVPVVAPSNAPGLASTLPSGHPSLGGPPSLAGPLPSGHPNMDGAPIPAGPLPSGAAIPPGHPSLGGDGGGGEPGAPDGDGPHGRGEADLPRIPPDSAGEDPSLPMGTIRAQIVDEKDVPVANCTVTLGILRTSVAQGESRSRTSAQTDAQGFVRFDGLKNGSGWAYRLTVINSSPDGTSAATYGAPPFNLPLDKGYSLIVHRFPVSTSIDQLFVAVAGADVGVEVRDDDVSVTLSFTVLNAGLTSWGLGDGLTLRMPAASKALRSPETMEDHKVEAIEGTGAKWTGSFTPGEATVSYDFKLPYDHEPNVDLELEMPPRLFGATVTVASRRGMSLAVDGFPAAKDDMSTVGVHVLDTTKQGSPKDQIGSLGIHIKGLPTAGPERWIATGVGLSVIAAGLFYALRIAEPEDPKLLAEARKRRRKTLLDELIELELAHREGRVGPVTYARERARLLDAIADVMEPIVETKPAKAEPAAATKRRARGSKARS